MPTKFGKQVHLGEIIQMKLMKQVMVTSLLQYHVGNLKYIFTVRRPMTTKPSRMVTYLDGLLSIKSDNHLISWSFEIT